MATEFLDEARIFVRAGAGGDGMIHFRREKYVPRGGPDGGDGGKGGDVVLVANPKLNTLGKFRGNERFSAPDGGRGGTTQKTGRNGQDLEIEVPVGTLVRDESTGRLMADLAVPGQRLIVARGGQGGRGNVHWKSSRNQAPAIAEKGDPPEERWLLLELKLLADVGIVGLPNAGKSTLLSVISNAKPKIAPYPFTTLTPNLGVVRLDYNEFVVADIPGLIEGAAKGAGLGHEFLRHIQRTRLLVHLLDGSRPDPLADFHQINTELLLFDERFETRPQLVVVNKLDLPEATAKYATLEKALGALGYSVMGISAVTRQNLRPLLGKLFQMLAELPPETNPVLASDDLPLYQAPDDPNSFTVEKRGEGEFAVYGKAIERTVARTVWYSQDSVRRFQKILEVIGVSAALEKAGIQVGDTVHIGAMELEWGE